MTSRTWIRRLLPRTPHAIREAPAQSRPHLEAAEGRLAPATLKQSATKPPATWAIVLAFGFIYLG
jgi:hypothetical protein